MSITTIFTPFSPSVALPFTSASANVKRTIGEAVSQDEVRIANDSSSTVFVEFGKDNTVTAVVGTSMPILAGSSELFQLNNTSQAYVAAVSASGSGSIYITSGRGR